MRPYSQKTLEARGMIDEGKTRAQIRKRLGLTYRQLHWIEKAYRKKAVPVKRGRAPKYDEARLVALSRLLTRKELCLIFSLGPTMVGNIIRRARKSARQRVTPAVTRSPCPTVIHSG